MDEAAAAADDDDDDDEDDDDDDDAVAALVFVSFSCCPLTAACASENARAANRYKPCRSGSDGLAAASSLASTYDLASAIADVMSWVIELDRLLEAAAQIAQMRQCLLGGCRVVQCALA